MMIRVNQWRSLLKPMVVFFSKRCGEKLDPVHRGHSSWLLINVLVSCLEQQCPWLSRWSSFVVLMANVDWTLFLSVVNHTKSHWLDFRRVESFSPPSSRRRHFLLHRSAAVENLPFGDREWQILGGNGWWRTQIVCAVDFCSKLPMLSNPRFLFFSRVQFVEQKPPDAWFYYISSMYFVREWPVLGGNAWWRTQIVCVQFHVLSNQHF